MHLLLKDLVKFLCNLWHQVNEFSPYSRSPPIACSAIEAADPSQPAPLLLPALLSSPVSQLRDVCACPLPQNFNWETAWVKNAFSSHLSQKKQAFFYYWFPAEAVRYELASALTWQARLTSMWCAFRIAASDGSFLHPPIEMAVLCFRGGTDKEFLGKIRPQISHISESNFGWSPASPAKMIFKWNYEWKTNTQIDNNFSSYLSEAAQDPGGFPAWRLLPWDIGTCSCAWVAWSFLHCSSSYECEERWGWLMGLFSLLVASRVNLRRGFFPRGLNTPAGLAAGSPSLPGSKYRDK